MAEDTPAKAPQIPHAVRYNRRTFLERARDVTAGAIFAGLGIRITAEATADIWQPVVVDWGIEALEKPENVEKVLAASATSLENFALTDKRAPAAPKIEKNLSYSSMFKIISNVLEERKKLGKPITYSRVNGYQELPYYLDNIKAVAHNPKYRDKFYPNDKHTGYLVPEVAKFLGYDPIAITHLLHSTDIFPQDAIRLWEKSQQHFADPSSYLMEKSGFFERTKEMLGEDCNVLLDLKPSTTDMSENAWKYLKEHSAGIKQAISEYIWDIIKHVQLITKERGEPVSSGEIFRYCMDRNNGDIPASIWDTYKFQLAISRDSTVDSVIGENAMVRYGLIEWFRNNIKDEYGLVGNYNHLSGKQYPYKGKLALIPGLSDPNEDGDLSLINQIGKPYHSWDIVYSLCAVPPEVSQLGVMNQATGFLNQGPIKIANDFRVALELRKLYALFSQYSQHSKAN